MWKTKCNISRKNWIKQDYPRVKLVYGEEKIFYIPTDLQYDNIAFGSTNKDYSKLLLAKKQKKKDIDTVINGEEIKNKNIRKNIIIYL